MKLVASGIWDRLPQAMLATTLLVATGSYQANVSPIHLYIMKLQNDRQNYFCGSSHIRKIYN